jgi:amino acid permease
VSLCPTLVLSLFVSDKVTRLVVIPLSFLRRLDSLKYTSIIALVSIGYLVVLVVYHFAKGDDMGLKGDISIVPDKGIVPILASFPVIVFAYTCHQNMFSILNEIEDNSPFRTSSVVLASIGSSSSIYLLVAITGYLTFGDNVAGNIVAQCKFHISLSSLDDLVLINRRHTFSGINHRQSSNRCASHVLVPSASSSLPCFSRCGTQVASSFA